MSAVGGSAGTVTEGDREGHRPFGSGLERWGLNKDLRGFRGAAMGRASGQGPWPQGLPHLAYSGLGRSQCAWRPVGKKVRRWEVRWGGRQCLGGAWGYRKCPGLEQALSRGMALSKLLETPTSGISIFSLVGTFFSQSIFLKVRFKARV